LGNAVHAFTMLGRHGCSWCASAWTQDWALDATWSLNGPSWLVDTMAMMHIAPTGAVEQLVFGCAFVTSRLPVDLNRGGTGAI
jgi:hypothetical protein